MAKVIDIRRPNQSIAKRPNVAIGRAGPFAGIGRTVTTLQRIIGYDVPDDARTFKARLDILPPAQQRLWPELSETPEEFTLYGDTAIALRLGHRVSVDFDFFAATPFVPIALLRNVPYLKGATVRQSAQNTLTVTVERDGPVQASFFGGLGLGQVASAETAIGPGAPFGRVVCDERSKISGRAGKRYAA